MPTPQITPMPQNVYSSNGYGGGYGSSYIGNYTNLPSGISNAGGGANSAYVRNVQPNELMSTQLNGLLASNSPYMQQARASGLRTAASRGLLNSGMAAGNSMASAIQAAAPIAQQDANTYGTAAGQNMDALNSILATNLNNYTSRANAAGAAAASRYGSELNLLNNRENRTFEGDQAGLGRSFQDYMQRQQFGNQLRQSAFNLGANMLNSDNSFTHQAYLNGMDNPFVMNDPEAFQGYLDRATQGSNSYYDNLFGFATNAGQPTNGWSENSPWYDTPSNYAPLPTWQGGSY